MHGFLTLLTLPTHTLHTHTQFFSFQKQQPYPSSFSSISIHISNNEQNQLVPPWKYDFIPTASKLVLQLPPDALHTNSKQIILLKTIRVSVSQWEKPKSFPCPTMPNITGPAYLSDLQLCCSPSPLLIPLLSTPRIFPHQPLCVLILSQEHTLPRYLLVSFLT